MQDDLRPKYYQDQYILVQLYKEFVRVQFHGGEAVFGNTVDLLGEYNTERRLLAMDPHR